MLGDTIIQADKSPLTKNSRKEKDKFQIEISPKMDMENSEHIKQYEMKYKSAEISLKRPIIQSANSIEILNEIPKAIEEMKQEEETKSITVAKERKVMFSHSEMSKED